MSRDAPDRAGPAVRISTIVCTHNRKERLKGCLRALLSQTLPVSSYEVIVVDNCSSDGTRELAEKLAGAEHHLVYAYEPRLGLSAARNTGFRIARGEIIAFTDDDAEPFPDWLERIIGIFDSVRPRPAIVGGEIEPLWSAPRPDWVEGLPERMMSARLGWSKVPIYLDLSNSFICEVNCAYPREILETYGPWPENLGRQGNLLLSNENIINKVIFEREKFVYFDPDVRVHHHIHADRLTAMWLARRYFWQGVSFAIIEQSKGGLPREQAARELASLTRRPEAFLTAYDPQATREDIQQSLMQHLLLGRCCQFMGLVMGDEEPALEEGR